MPHSGEQCGPSPGGAAEISRGPTSPRVPPPVPAIKRHSPRMGRWIGAWTIRREISRVRDPAGVPGNITAPSVWHTLGGALSLAVPSGGITSLDPRLPSLIPPGSRISTASHLFIPPITVRNQEFWSLNALPGRKAWAQIRSAVAGVPQLRDVHRTLRPGGGGLFTQIGLDQAWEKLPCASWSVCTTRT